MKEKKPLQNLKDLEKKVDKLKARLQELGSVLVAFSGGLDSTFLLAVAREVLGKEKVLAVTAVSPTYPSREQDSARRFAEKWDIRHMVIASREMEDNTFVSNPPERCYYCKKGLMEQLFEIAHREGLAHVAHGANSDDMDDFRPGLRAADEMGAVAPLVEAGLRKDEIRFLSKQMGLPTWDNPSMSCLAARIPYGEAITAEKLRMVEEAEDYLLDKGFTQVRVRHHGSVARIEVLEEEIDRFLKEDLRLEVIARLREIGFTHVALDLEGYISGKMNRDLITSSKRG